MPSTLERWHERQVRYEQERMQAEQERATQLKRRQRNIKRWASQGLSRNTMGYIPYLETYPGSYVPEPWQLVDHYGGTAPRDLFRELLALTKMNVNNCTFADGAPITLLFAQRIGDIMKHVPEHGVVRPQYKFYM
jgi:hypothetical protein